MNDDLNLNVGDSLQQGGRPLASENEEIKGFLGKIHYLLKENQKDMEALSDSLKILQGQRFSDKNKFSIEISHRTQETILTMLQEKINPKFAELSRTVNAFLSQKPSRSPKEFLKHYGLILLCTFVSSSLGAGCVYVFLDPKKSLSSYSAEVIYYGSLLKAAWPHLTDKEKERLYKVRKSRK